MHFELTALPEVDAEGHEMAVLRGAEELLASGRVRKLVMEYQPGMLSTSGTDHVGILYFLRHYGFYCYSLKVAVPTSFEEFGARYEQPDHLKLTGLSSIEDLVCEHLSAPRAVPRPKGSATYGPQWW